MFSSILPPKMTLSAHCKNDFNFNPLSHWPQALPAIAINGYLIAGFKQEFCLNHEIEKIDSETISQLFLKFHPQLTIIEIACLWDKSKQHKWFPIDAILKRFSFSISTETTNLLQFINNLPAGFKNWINSSGLDKNSLITLYKMEPAFRNALMYALVSKRCPKNKIKETIQICSYFEKAGTNSNHLKFLDESIHGSDWLTYLHSKLYSEKETKTPEVQKAPYFQ